MDFIVIYNTIFYFYITKFCLYRFECLHYVYVNLYCDACCAGPPGKQPLAEGGYPVEIKVNNCVHTCMYNRPKYNQQTF